MKPKHSIPKMIQGLAVAALAWLLQGGWMMMAADQVPGHAKPSSDAAQAGSSSSVSAADIPAVPPDEYVHLHAMAARPGSADGPAGLDLLTQGARPAWVGQYLRWTNAMARLAEVGDAYTLKLLGSLETEDAQQRAVIAKTVEAIETRLKQPSRCALEDIVQARLERAAYADVTCNALERSLVSWALDTTKAMIQQPEVRGRLRELRQRTPPADPSNPWMTSMAKRVQNYADRLESGR